MTSNSNSTCGHVGGLWFEQIAVTPAQRKPKGVQLQEFLVVGALAGRLWFYANCEQYADGHGQVSKRASSTVTPVQRKPKGVRLQEVE